MSTRHARIGVSCRAFTCALVSLSSLACSSSSSGPSEPASSQDSGASSFPDAASPLGQGNPTIPPAGDPSECAATGTGGCSSCCAADVPGAGTFYGIALDDCLCTGSGACGNACTQSECTSGAAVSTACNDCMQGHLASCTQQAQTACSGDKTCKSWQTCLASCPH